MAIILENKVNHVSDFLEVDIKTAFELVYGDKNAADIKGRNQPFTDNLTQNIQMVLIDIINTASYYIIDNRLPNINTRAISQIFEHTYAFMVLKNNLKIMFYQDGVQPKIHQEILPKDDDKPNKRLETGIKYIRIHQKSTDFLIDSAVLMY